MPTFSSLPPEIIDLIVDTLALGDRRLSSVKALSLVCHATLPHCREQLFATISLFKPPKKDLQTASTLQELLTITPQLGLHIRSIVYALGGSEASSDLSMLPVVSRKLAKLQSLRLVAHYAGVRVLWNQSLHRHALLHLLHLPTLTHLELDSVHGFTLSDLIPCTGLRDLDINNVGFEDEPVVLSMVPPKPISLDRFCIGNQNFESVRALWRAQRSDGASIIDLVNIKTLSIYLQRRQELRGMVELFGNGRQLTELNLSAFDPSPPLDGLYDILQGSLKTLKHLTFDLWAFYGIAPDNSIPALSRELGKVQGRNAIESIRITISTFSAPAPVRRDEWGTLDHALSKGGWPALKYVSLMIIIADDEELEEAVLR